MATQLVAPKISFINLPGELRNTIYHFYFSSTFSEQGLEPFATCRRVRSLRPALALLSTSRLIKSETTPIFWIDYVQRCHWSFGSQCDEDERTIRFCDEARKYTLDLEITFQKRNLEAMSLLTNIVWLVLESALTEPEAGESLQKLQAEWDVKHQIPGGFVWDKELRVGSHECSTKIKMRYEHHQNGRSWVRFGGRLLLIDWGSIFALADAKEERLLI